MARHKPELEPIWTRALAAEFGLRIKVDGEPNLMMNDLYATRATMNDPRLEALRICSLKNGELWIVKKDVKLEEVEMPHVATD